MPRTPTPTGGGRGIIGAPRRGPANRPGRETEHGTTKAAIACQGGGMCGAFTAGVLAVILEAGEGEERGQPAGRRRIEIDGSSGASAGALGALGRG